MELFQKLLSKEAINYRFVRAVYAIISHNLVSSKGELAESLGVKPAKFSEILNGRMKAGTDMIAILCDFYKVSPEWLLMSRGNNIFRKDAQLPKYWIDDDDLTSIYPSDKIAPSSDYAQTADPFLILIREKDETIRQQAEDIGKLKERIAQLEREKNVSGVSFQSAPQRETVDSL